MWRNFSFLYRIWKIYGVFIEVYAIFVPNLCGEKNDKYEVCRQLDDNIFGQLITQPLDIHVSIIFIRLIFQTSIISDQWSSIALRLNWDWKLKLWEGVLTKVTRIWPCYIFGTSTTWISIQGVIQTQDVQLWHKTRLLINVHVCPITSWKQQIKTQHKT